MTATPDAAEGVDGPGGVLDGVGNGPWWQGPLCISDVQLTPDEVRQMGPRAAAAKLAGLGFNVQELAFPALPGYEGSYLRAPWRPEDYGEFVDACHEQGIRVTPYLNVHGFYTALAEEHPAWPQRYEDGSLALRGNGLWVPPCNNSPWRDFAFDAIGRMVLDYDVDGIFLDGPLWSERCCYCAICRERFRGETGDDLPAWGDQDDPAWPRFVEFRIESLARFLRDLRARLDQVSPQAHRILYMNNASLGSSWSGARATRRLAPYLDILGNERANLFNAPPPVTPLWLVGAAVKILETQAQRGGQPTVQYCCFRHLPWDYYGLPAAEYRVHVAGALANGAHPQVMGGLRYLDAKLQEVVRDLNALQRRHPEVYCGSRSAANVALLWPQATADWGGTRLPMLATQQARNYPPPPPGSEPPTAPGPSVVQEEFYGWAEALFRAGYAYDVIDDATLEEGDGALARYRALVLPAAQCLSDAACAAVEAWVRRGGHLIATGTTSLCTEQDVPRRDFALAAVLGASYAGRLIGPLPIDYLELTVDVTVPVRPAQDQAAAREHGAGDAIGPADLAALLQGVEHAVLPAPPAAVAVQAKATTLAVHLHKLVTRYEPIQPDPQQMPALVANRWGEGTCVYFPGAFGSAYWQHRFPDYRRLLQNAVRWRCAAQVSLRSGDAAEDVTAEPFGTAPASRERGATAKEPAAIPDTVEVSWRRAQDGAWLVHLVNHTGTMSRPIERLVPVHDLRVALHALSGVAGTTGDIEAHALVADASLAVKHEGSIPVLHLPRLEAYEAIVVRPGAAP